MDGNNIYPRIIVVCLILDILISGYKPKRTFSSYFVLYYLFSIYLERKIDFVKPPPHFLDNNCQLISSPIYLLRCIYLGKGCVWTLILCSSRISILVFYWWFLLFTSFTRSLVVPFTPLEESDDKEEKVERSRETVTSLPSRCRIYKPKYRDV